MRFLLFLFFFVLAAVFFVIGVYIVQLNLNDMIHNGVNFWNTFWIMLVVSSAGGILSSRK